MRSSVLFFLFLVHVGFSQEKTEVIPMLSKKEKQQYLKVINTVRKKSRTCGEYGYFPSAPIVMWSDKLYFAAYEHNQDMVTENYFAHTGSGAKSDWCGYALGKKSSTADRISNHNFNWQRCSENISAGTNRLLAQSAIDSWVNSPIHCKNMMDPNVTKVGLAHIQKPKTKYIHYWTLNFAKELKQ